MTEFLIDSRIIGETPLFPVDDDAIKARFVEERFNIYYKETNVNVCFDIFNLSFSSLMKIKKARNINIDEVRDIDSEICLKSKQV